MAVWTVKIVPERIGQMRQPSLHRTNRVLRLARLRRIFTTPSAGMTDSFHANEEDVIPDAVGSPDGGASMTSAQLVPAIKQSPLDKGKFLSNNLWVEGTMAVWRVNITESPGTFVAVNQPKAPAGTVYADPNDVVFWNNETGQQHQLALPDGLLPPVEPRQQTIAWTVSPTPGATIQYHCAIHPDEKGTIVVTGQAPTS